MIPNVSLSETEIKKISNETKLKPKLIKRMYLNFVVLSQK